MGGTVAGAEGELFVGGCVNSMFSYLEGEWRILRRVDEEAGAIMVAFVCFAQGEEGGVAQHVVSLLLEWVSPMEHVRIGGPTKKKVGPSRREPRRGRNHRREMLAVRFTAADI